MKFPRQNFGSEVAEVVPSLFRSLNASATGPVSSPLQPVGARLQDNAGRADGSSSVACIR
jgi:hypothetical protein